MKSSAAELSHPLKRERKRERLIRKKMYVTMNTSADRNIHIRNEVEK